MDKKCKGIERSTTRLATRIKPSLLALAVAQALTISPAAKPAIINLGAGCTLTDAVLSANTDSPIGSCAMGSGADVINLETGVNVSLSRYGATPNGLPIITSNITINGGGVEISRNVSDLEKFRLMEVSTASGILTLNSLTLTGGHAYSGDFPDFHGGAIYLHDSASLVGNHLTVDLNTSSSESFRAGNGGGINATGADVELNNSVVTNNQSFSQGGGIYVSYGSLTISNTEVSANSSRTAGGGIRLIAANLNGDTVTISNNTAGTDTTSGDGGGINAFYNSNVILTSSTIEANHATGVGGGLDSDFLSPLTLTDTQVNANTAVYEGGGLYLQRTAVVTFTGGSLNNNTAGLHGGGVYARYTSSITLQSTTVSGNSAGTGQASRYGGGALVTESATLISNDTLWSNNFSRYGGAIAIRGSLAEAVTININNSTFTGNSAAAQGGALRVRFGHSTSITQSTFTQNHATNAGGAILNSSGNMVVQDSTVFNNSSNSGAGLFNSGELTLVNSTVSANTANTDGGGVAMGYASTTLINSTILGNQVLGGTGGGVWINSGAAGSIYNSIIAGNAAATGAEIYAAPSSSVNASVNNLLGTSAVNSASAFSQFVPSGTDIVATSDSATQSFALSAIVGDLDENGGPTETHALISGSPAQNAADQAVCTANMISTDQRGKERDGKCDIGAYESPNDGTIFVVPLANGRAVVFEL